MLYIVSGTSRAGKTIIAKKISARKGIPYVSLDWLVMGFTNGIPEYGIHDKLYPDEIAERFWSFLKAMCENMLWSDVDYIIEGEAVLPHLIAELLEKHPDKIKICFVGYTDVNIPEKVKDVKEFSWGKSDWLSNEPEDYIIRHLTNMVTYSRKIEKLCNETKIRYFDTSTDFTGGIDQAVNYLMA